MKRHLLLFMILSMIGFNAMYAQSVVDLTASDDPVILKTTLTDASYDENATILLKRGMEYDITSTVISKSVKIMSAAGDGPSAILVPGGSSLDIASGSAIDTLMFSDVEIHGDYAAGYLMNWSTDGTLNKFLIKDANIHHLRGVFRAKNNANKTINLFSLDNCVVDSIDGYSLMQMDVPESYCADVAISNCTFTNLNQLLRWRTAVGTDVNSVTISNSTFYNTPNDGYIIRLDNITITNPVEITNCIFGLSNNKLLSGTATINATNSYTTTDCLLPAASFATPPTAYAGADADLWVDPANGDFAFMDNSFAGLFTAGDPRWAPATLKHSYTFEDGTAADVVGDADGTLQGTMISIANGMCTVTGSTSSTSGYVQFDGTALALNTFSAVTLEAMIKAGNGENTSYTMLSYFGSNTAGQRCLWIQPTRSGNESRVEVNNGSTTKTALKGGVELDDGLTHHVVAVLTDQSLKYYLNGDLLAEVATGGDFVSQIGTDFACLFKGVWNDRNYNGSIDEFNIYDGELSAEVIKGRALDFVGDRLATLSGITVGTGELTPAFNPNTTVYAVEIPVGTATVSVAAEPTIAGATVTGTGDVTISGGLGTAVINVLAVDGVTTMDYTVYFKEADPNCYQPLYQSIPNIVADPECTDLSMWGGWGNRSIYVGPDAYCGVTCAKLVAPTNGCEAALDIGNFKWEPNSTYRLYVMVKTIGGSIGFLANGSDPNFGFAVDTKGDWMLVDTTFTTGPNAGTNFYSFNTCDFGSNCSEAYIDNYQLYRNPPKLVGYVTENKTMATTATQPGNDPIIQMLQADKNFEVVAHVVANTAVIDLSGYDIVVGQEPFNSSSAIWKPGGTLGLANIPVPFIYNKMFALRDTRAFTGGATGSGGEVASTYSLKVDAAKQTKSLFNGITFVADTVKIFKTGAADNGGDGTKGLQYATDVVINPDTTLLAHGMNDPANATVCVNHLPEGAVIGSETLQADMITMAMNYGAICKDSGTNMTDAGLTLWRNAFYLLAGLEVPTGAYSNTVNIAVSVSNGMVATNATAHSFEVTVPSGTTSVDLMVDVINGRNAQIPTISGLSDGMDAEYDLTVDVPIGSESVTYKVYVHVQSDYEIAYLSADGSGVVADARMYDQNPVHLMKEAGYSVTFLKKDILNAGNFNYSPYAAMVMAPGNSSGNITQFAKDGYKIPVVCMQPDEARSTKWGWVGVDKDDDLQMNVTKVYDAKTAQLVVTNTDHYITKFYSVDDTIVWTLGTADSADWPGREIKSYNLLDSIPEAVAVARIPADGSSLQSVWAVPAGVSVRSVMADGSFARTNLASNVVILNVFSDGLLYPGGGFMPLLSRAIDWASGNMGTQPDPGTLTHSYLFNDGTADDAVGTADGTLQAGATVSGGSLVLANGQYASLPAGDILINSYPEVSVEAWYTPEGGTNTGWHTIFAFGRTLAGSGFGADYFHYQPAREDNVSKTAISTGNTSAPWEAENGVAGVEIDDNAMHHVVSILTDTAAIMYQDGVYIGYVLYTGTNAISTVGTEVAYFGKGVYASDPTWKGTIQEVNIYNKALSADEVKYQFNRGPIEPDLVKVAYFNNDARTMVADASTHDNDPIVQMMRHYPEFDIDVMIVAIDAVVDLTGYEVVVVQEGFDSGSGILMPGGSLGLESIKVPFIYNKAYALRNGKAVTSTTAAAGQTPASQLHMTIESGMESHALFSGIALTSDSIKMFEEPAADDGGSGAKTMNFAYDLEISDATTLIGRLKGAESVTVCVNDIPAGTVLGTQDTLQARMIAMSNNFGAISRHMGTNMTDENLTMWRNAFFLAAGLTAPDTMYHQPPVGNNDATLSDLQVDGTTVDNFASDTYSYDVELPKGTTTVPTVTATTTDANATYVITAATALPGSTTVDVTAEDGVTMLTYTINFTVAPDAIEPNGLAGISIFPNPVRHELTVTNVENATISIYELNGILVKSINNPDRDVQIDVSDLDAGVYIIKIQKAEGVKFSKFVRE